MAIRPSPRSWRRGAADDERQSADSSLGLPVSRSVCLRSRRIVEQSDLDARLVNALAGDSAWRSSRCSRSPPGAGSSGRLCPTPIASTARGDWLRGRARVLLAVLWLAAMPWDLRARSGSSARTRSGRPTSSGSSRATSAVARRAPAAATITASTACCIALSGARVEPRTAGVHATCGSRSASICRPRARRRLRPRERAPGRLRSSRSWKRGWTIDWKPPERHPAQGEPRLGWLIVLARGVVEFFALRR